MRKLLNTLLNRPWARVALVGLAAIAVLSGSHTLTHSVPYAAPPMPIPAPTSASLSPSASPAPSASSPGTGGQAAGEVVKPIVPTPSAADTKAEQYLDFHWDVFVDALTGPNGTRLPKAQLAQPPVVFVADLSGCPPGAENRTSTAVKAAARFCTGTIKLNSAAFNKLNDNEQRIATASAFIYHALSKTTADQRKLASGATRNNAQVLGCLQASLSYWFELFGGGLPEDVWVVMDDSLNGGYVSDSYWATIDADGKWS